MAEALLSALLEQLASVTQQQVQKKLRLLVGVEDEIEKLSETFTTIKAVLEDAEKKQVTDKSVKLWLENLKDVAYDLEDLLEEWGFRFLITSQQDQEAGHHRRPIKDKLVSSSFSSSPCCSCFRKLVVRHKTGHKIKAIRERLNFLVKEKNKFKLVEGSSFCKDPQSQRKNLITTSPTNISKIYGRNYDKNLIISKFLMNDSSSSSAQMLPVDNNKEIPLIMAVIGMGGLGKTTLAQLVYNDHQVQDHFEKTMWVCVSDPFDKVKLAKEIIGGTGDSNHPTASENWNDQLHCSLSNAVKDKRFLLVLDDVWTEDYAEWEPLKIALDYGSQGSRILATTRSERVALMMGASYIHRIGELPEPDCWSLFSAIAFAGRNIKDPEKTMWEDVGKKIVKKCKGVPLSVKAIAGALFFKRTIEDWEGVLESDDTWQEWEVEHKVLPSLLFSYYALPPNLKRCFTHCAIFPKDAMLWKDKLIKLWMAHGYLNIEGGVQNKFEKIGEEYFDNLAMRSFFQDIETDEYGRISRAKMHDLVHDLAQFLSKNEILFGELEKIISFDPKKIRHLTTSRFLKDVDSSLSTICNTKKLRRLKIKLKLVHFNNSSKFLFNADLTCLRELNMSGSDFEQLPNEIGKLIQLRYLDLTNSKNLIELPETLRYLRNLQTLRLNYCCHLCKLPEGMEEMISLRHLEIYCTGCLSYMPQGLGKLGNLHTLTKFIVSDMINTGCKLSALKDLNLLHGNLEIKGMCSVTNVNEANEANLKAKKHLNSVTLDFGIPRLENLAEGDMERLNGVLEGLQIHANMKNMFIRSYNGSRFPCWMMRDTLMMFKLQKLSLVQCKKCTHLPPLGRLPCLKYIYVSGMDEVKCIDRKFFGIDGSVQICFPMLKELHVANMASLEVCDFIEENVNIMPQLCEISITECPLLKTLLALGKLRSVERLELEGLVSVKYIGLELLGILNNSDVSDMSQSTKVAFPKLNFLTLRRMEELEEWEFPIGQNPDQIMPCLQELSIFYCSKLRTLSALEKLKMLEKLEIEGLNSVNHIGLEFLGVSNTYKDGGEPNTTIAFPKLNFLEFSEMAEWELWEFPVGQNAEIMPCLHTLIITDCMKLKALPALGRLRSLEKLEIKGMNSVKCIGLEFLGVVEDNNHVRVGTQTPLITEAFPKLISLTFLDMEELEKWVLPEAEDMVIMPCLLHLTIFGLRKLSALPALGKLKSLESLEIGSMDCVKRVGPEFWGILAADYTKRSGDGEPLSITVFPKLKHLNFYCIENWEEWEKLALPTRKNEEHIGAGGGREDISITMPCLNLLSINNCPRLKVIPCNISSCKPWKLEIKCCLELTHTCIPTRGMTNLQELKVDGETLCLT